MPTQTTTEKIEAFILAKRKPLEATRKHCLDLAATISKLAATVEDYVANPTPGKLTAALEAERDLPPLRSLREKVGEFDVEKKLAAILDRSFEIAPLLDELANERRAFIDQCKNRLKQFQSAAIFLAEPDQQVNIRLKIFAREIAAADAALGPNPRIVIDNWASDNQQSARSFLNIYGRLISPKLTLYDDVAEIINPDAPNAKVPSLKNLSPTQS